MKQMTLFLAFCILFFACGKQQKTQYEEGFVEVGAGVKLFYQRIGKGSEAVIVPLGWWMFDDFKRLADSTQKTFIFFDNRNRGRSSYLADTTQITIGHEIEDIEALRKHFGLNRIDLLGESYTGLLVILYGLKYPQNVNRIVQIGPVAYNPLNRFPDSLTNKSSQVDSVLFKKLAKLYDEGLHKDFPKEFSEMHWRVTSRVNLVGDSSFSSSIGKQWGDHFDYPNEWLPNFTRHLRYHFSSIKKLGINESEIRNLKIPTLVVSGTRDRNAPFGAARQWAELLPNSRLIAVADAGHIPWVENPQLVFGSIQVFLNGSWPKSAVQLPNR